MDWSSDKWLKSREIVTPDIIKDIKEYIKSDFARSDFDQLIPSDQKKLTLIVERLEVIQHLLATSKTLQKSKKSNISVTNIGNGMVKQIETYSIMIDGYEYAGFDFDIDALVIYLLLTCIDSLKGQPNYVDPFEWIKSQKISDYSIDWDKMKAEYQKEYGLSKRFTAAFTDDCNAIIQKELTENFAVVKLGDQKVKQESAIAWELRTQKKKLQRIASQFYSIRSGFTHASLRSFSPDCPINMSIDHGEPCLIRRHNSRPLKRILYDMIVSLTNKLIIDKH